MGALGDVLALPVAENAHPVPVAILEPFVVVAFAAIIGAYGKQRHFHPGIDFPDTADNLELGEIDHACSSAPMVWLERILGTSPRVSLQVGGLMRARRDTPSPSSHLKRIKTPLLAAEAFPIQKDSDSEAWKPSNFSESARVILTGRGI